VRKSFKGICPLTAHFPYSTEQYGVNLYVRIDSLLGAGLDMSNVMIGRSELSCSGRRAGHVRYVDISDHIIVIPS
jgi:hypothetical protein